NYINVTISGNSASFQGGGVFNNGNGSTKFLNSIIWNNNENGNTTLGSSSVYNTNSTSNPEFRYSIVANSGGSGSWDTNIGIDQTNNKDVDPQFVMEFDPLTAPGIGGDFH